MKREGLHKTEANMTLNDNEKLVLPKACAMAIDTACNRECANALPTDGEISGPPLPLALGLLPEG